FSTACSPPQAAAWTTIPSVTSANRTHGNETTALLAIIEPPPRWFPSAQSVKAPYTRKLREMSVGVLDSEVRTAVESGNMERAATLALKAHGQEILELLYALHRSEADGDDAFSLFAEALWRGLPR